MWKSLAIVVLGTIVIVPAPVQAQFRGNRGAIAPTGPVVSGNRGGLPPRAGPGNAGGRGRGPVNHHPRPIVPPIQWPIFYPPAFGFYSPFLGPTQLFSTPAYDANSYQAAPEPQPVNPSEVDLAYQVGQLAQEIQQLRDEQALQAARQQPPETRTLTEPAAAPVSTVLVFRDGHRLEIQNYATAGQTLWVFNQQASTKIPLSDLDLASTERENRTRGVRFHVPENSAAPARR